MIFLIISNHEVSIWRKCEVKWKSCLGTSRAMKTTVDAEISKHDISDGCHLQNDTVWFATVFKSVCTKTGYVSREFFLYTNIGKSIHAWSCVRYNVWVCYSEPPLRESWLYSVVAEFIVQSESCDYIKEPLQILNTWNPNWNPKFVMTNYSEAESWCLGSILPRYYCLPLRFIKRAGLGKVDLRQETRLE